jgi:hypothetical protein
MTGFVPEHSALSLSTALLTKATQHEGSIVQQSTTTTTTIYDSDEDNAKDSDKNMKVSQQQVKGKRLSARDFLSIHIQELEEQLNQQTNNWEVVLATGVHQDNLHDASTSRLQDIVINGHENGYDDAIQYRYYYLILMNDDTIDDSSLSLMILLFYAFQVYHYMGDLPDETRPIQ